MSATNWIRKIFGIKTFSSLGFLSWAMLATLFHIACHLAGLREHTTFISGTSASEANGVASSAVLGMIYLVSYFGFVLGVPILTLAAGIFAGLSAVTNGFRKTPKP